MTATILLGCQGWEYPAWIGSLYPPDTKPAEMLREYGTRFRTVELADTFAGIPPEPVVAGWRDSVPDGFVFSLKIPQQISHERRLRKSQSLLGRFVDRVSLLGDKLGPLLVQLPPSFRRTTDNEAVLRSFVEGLPSGFRWAVEFRGVDWLTPDVNELLTELGVSLVLADGRWVKRSIMLDLARQPQADFAYLRWDGSTRATTTDSSSDSLHRLSAWSVAVEGLCKDVDTVFGYFGNRFGDDGPCHVREFQELIDRRSPVSDVAERGSFSD